MPIFSIVYTVTDGKEKNGFTEINIPDNITIANMVIFVTEMTLLVDPLLTGKISRVGLAATLPLSLFTGIKTSAAADSDIEEGARFQFRTENGFFTGLRLPTFDESLIATGSELVDLTDTDVAAFVAAMVSGIDLTASSGTGTVQPVDKRGEDVTALEWAIENFQNS